MSPTSLHERLQKRREGSSRGGIGWKPKDGANHVRILPPHSKYIGNFDAMEDLAISFQMHYFRLGDGRQTEVSRCLGDLKQKCPACEMSWKYKDADDPALKELAGQVRAATSYLFNMLDIDNLQAGIQVWGANYTCWDKIMEVAANPAWGYVVDPANGINFEITLTAGNRTRTGRNQYSAVPDPTRTTVMGILEAIPDWSGQLDKLEEQILPPKTTDEITALLDEMGFPVKAGGAPRAVGAAPVPVAVAAAAPQPVRAVAAPVPAAPAAPQPVAVPAAQPVAVPVAQAVPAPVAQPVRAAAQAAPQSAAVPAAYDYDPGPTYTPKMTDAERPAGAPRCFSDYDPTVHPCQACPVIVECQLAMLGD